MKIGIIGKGLFGKNIYENAKNIGEIVFFTGKQFNVSFDIDWVVIATPAESHYKLAKYFMNRKINVFCEKPPTKSHKETSDLIVTAYNNDVKIYFDDILIYNNIYTFYKNDLKKSKSLKFKWEKLGTFKDNIFNNLTYHDLYLLVDLFGDQDLNSLSFNNNQSNKKSLSFYYGSDIKIELEYDRVSKNHNKLIESDYVGIHFLFGAAQLFL